MRLLDEWVGAPNALRFDEFIFGPIEEEDPDKDGQLSFRVLAVRRRTVRLAAAAGKNKAGSENTAAMVEDAAGVYLIIYLFLLVYLVFNLIYKYYFYFCRLIFYLITI
jgi:hypothetical protein